MFSLNIAIFYENCFMEFSQENFALLDNVKNRPKLPPLPLQFNEELDEREPVLFWRTSSGFTLPCL